MSAFSGLGRAIELLGRGERFVFRDWEFCNSVLGRAVPGLRSWRGRRYWAGCFSLGESSIELGSACLSCALRDMGHETAVQIWKTLFGLSYL